MKRDDKRLAYQGKVEAHLKEWGSQIDGWLDGLSADQRHLLDELNRKRQIVRRKLAEMKDARDDQWQHLRSGMNRAVEEMRQAMDAARGKIVRH
jgi:DNA-binding transcriptional MerR regulator